MEKIINKYPNIISDFSQLINFNFNDILSYFNQIINSFESEYYFLINPNYSLLYPNNKLQLKNKIIDEIINIAFEIKINHSSSIVKFFTYKKYAKEISEINEEDCTEMEKERIRDLLIKEIGDSSKSDIITSLSSLYSKIVKPLNEENRKKKILKIIIVNNQLEKYKNINEKVFSEEKLLNILNEFINDKSQFLSVELKYLDDRLILQKRKGFEKVSDFPTGQTDILNNENKDENIKIIKSIYASDELLKKSEKISLDLYKKWYEISTNEIINTGIENLDELLEFYKDIMNSILYAKHKISINTKNKEKFVEQINKYISFENLNKKKNEIISYDANESFNEEINMLKERIKDKNFDSFIKKLKENKRYYNCVGWNKIVNYLLGQKKYINQFLDILQNSKALIELFEKEIIKKGKEIINDEDEKEEEDDDANNYL